LNWLDCHNNNLTSLNLKNGNNENFSYFNSENNPSLTCINVDNEPWSTTNWIYIDSQSFFNEDCDALGVDDFNLPEIKMYPNPASTTIKIEIKQEGTYKLSNITGKIIQKGQLTFGNNEFDITSLSKGMYFIEIKTAHGIINKKLMKH